MVVGCHRRVDRHRQGNCVAILGNFRKLYRNLALFRRFASSKLRDLICRLFGGRRGALAGAYETKRRASSGER